MRQDLQIGFVTGTTRQEVAELEALPIDSLWIGGHVASPNGSPEAMAQLARLSAVAERVKVGSAILLLPLYAPGIVGKQIADLDRATDGRIILGVGIGGEYEADFQACQVPIKQRGPRTDEAIPLLRRIWTAEEITHDGRFYPMEKVKIFPAPVQPGGPPIVVAGRKDPAMVRAATLGDGWMPYLYSPRAYAESAQRIREVATERGRDLSGFHWTMYLFVSVDDDPDKALEQLAGFLGGNYRQDFRAFADKVAAAGTPEQVAARVQQYVDAGARHIIFSVATRGSRAAMAKRLMEEVIPRVKVAGWSG